MALFLSISLVGCPGGDDDNNNNAEEEELSENSFSCLLENKNDFSDTITESFASQLCLEVSGTFVAPTDEEKQELCDAVSGEAVNVEDEEDTCSNEFESQDVTSYQCDSASFGESEVQLILDGALGMTGLVEVGIFLGDSHYTDPVAVVSNETLEAEYCGGINEEVYSKFNELIEEQE